MGLEGNWILHFYKSEQDGSKAEMVENEVCKSKPLPPTSWKEHERQFRALQVVAFVCSVLGVGWKLEFSEDSVQRGADGELGDPKPQI